MKKNSPGTLPAVLLISFLLLLCPVALEAVTGPELQLPGVLLSGVPFDAKIIPPSDSRRDSITYSLKIQAVDGLERHAAGAHGKIYHGSSLAGRPVTIENIVLDDGSAARFLLEIDDAPVQIERDILPGWVSILPPFMAILLAIMLRQVLLSLFLGIWLGTSFLYNLNPWTSFFRAVDTIIIDALVDRSHIEIILFSLMLGGMIGLITRNGGTAGIIERMKSISTSARRGQLATWAMGILVFFDDYANTLIVGNTMRPITDRLRISREKLSYIVDATAAPVSSLAVISTWIGFEVGLISDAFASLHLGVDPYLMFLETIPYRFYPILSLLFVLIIGLTGRDFGPMLRAERRSRSSGKLIRDGSVPLSNLEAEMTAPPDGVPLRWVNAVLPIAVVILATAVGLWISGSAAVASSGLNPDILSLRQIITEANTFDVLIWASTLGVVTAMTLSLFQKILPISGVFEAWVGGIKSMMMAMIVLVLAWSIGRVCEEIGTASYVISASRGLFSPRLLPALTFIISAVISFSTGTSWATMAIVIPIVTPLSFNMSGAAGFAAQEVHLNLVGTLSGVLAGSIFGDHCSPISDTTIMSSMASSVDHVDHVRTQLPYALLVGCVGVLFGDIPSGYGLNPFVSLALGTVALIMFLRFFGKKVETERG